MSDWIINEENTDIWPCPEYATRDEAIEAGRKMWPGHAFYIGRAEWYAPTVDAMVFLEDQAMQAWDACGEFAEDWLGHIPLKSPEVKDLQQRLQSAFDRWLEETHNAPSFFLVHDVELIAEEAIADGD